MFVWKQSAGGWKCGAAAARLLRFYSSRSRLGVYAAHPSCWRAALRPSSQTAVQLAKPLVSNVAAIVDGHTITVDQRARDLAMQQDGPNITTRLIENYLLEQAAEERHIVVTQREIDDRVQVLAKAIAPMTLEQGLKAHHTTLAGLQDDIRYWYLRIKLAELYIAPVELRSRPHHLDPSYKMARCLRWTATRDSDALAIR